MLPRLAALALLTFLPALPQSPMTAATFGGSGNDSIRSMAVDASGNIWVVGTTFSADLPLLNPFQPLNSGTQVVFSTDAGATWKPLSSPQPNANPQQPPLMAVDPTNASILYVASGNNVCKSTDAGRHFRCVALTPETFRNVTSLAIDPHQPSTIYVALTSPGAIYKSIDGGQTFADSSTGLPTQAIDTVVIDPFHSNVLYVWTGSAGYVSSDAGASWQPSTLPWPATTTIPGLHFTFDPVTSGVVYGPGYAISGIFIQKSSDGGKSWTTLNAPFVGCCVVADPKVAGVLYGGVGSDAFWKSTDAGATWTSSKLPEGFVGPVSVDPANPQIILAGQYRSADGGKTWAATNVSRSLQPLFAPSAPGTAYAIGPVTSDAFVAEFLPDGKTLVFASYFGGANNETGNAIALDYAGNVWIAGSTSSTDLPVTAGAFQNTLKGTTNGFIAKLSSDGKLLAATYLGGSKNDSMLGIAVSPQGNPWLIGSWTSNDFPFTTGAPPLIPITLPQGGVLSELDSSAQVLYSMPIDGTFDASGKGIAIDPSGNVIVTGSNGSKAFVLKLDASARQIYLQTFGGTKTPPLNAFLLPSLENARTAGIAVVADQTGNIYVTGSTSASDFPVTSNAAQTTIGSGCPYPALTSNTGLIGVIGFTLIDDSFVMKLAPDGKVSYATFIGGSCYDHPTSIAVNGAANGNVIIAGETDSADYPLLAAVEGGPGYRGFLSFVSSLSADGSTLTYSSYLHAGTVPSVAASNGSIYVAGSVGYQAQTQPDSGFTPPPVPVTDGYLAVLHPPSAAPKVNLTQVANAFSLQPGPIAPGEIVTIRVPGFVPAQSIDIGLNVLAALTTNLGGVTVTFDGIPAYLVSIFNGKIECIAPVGIAGQSSTAVQVNINGSESNVLNVIVAPTALGVLSADGSGSGLANARNPDGTLNSASNPAPRNSAVTVYFTGAGVTNPPEPDGMPAASAAIVPVAAISSSCSGVHALPGFVPGIFACSYQTPSAPSGPQYTVSLGFSQGLLIYVK